MAATRWGIAGCGRISHDFIAGVRCWPTSEHQVVACAARDASRAEKFAKDLKIPKSYGSYQEMAADPDIDIVYVGTIHPTHCEVSCIFMNAGKNVVCEKPLGMNLKQVQTCVDTAKKNNVFFMEGMWSRFFPVYDRIREEIKKGSIGEVGHVVANFGKRKLVEVDRIADKSTGGGVLLDIGCYVLQFALMAYAGEEPVEVHAAGGFSKDGVDSYQNITLKFSNDRTAQLTAHGIVALPNNGFVCGTEGIIQIPNFFWCPTGVIVNGEKAEYPLPTGDALEEEKHEHCTGFAYEAQACRDALNKGLKEHPHMTHDDSIRLSKLIDQIRQQLGIKYDADE